MFANQKKKNIYIRYVFHALNSAERIIFYSNDVLAYIGIGIVVLLKIIVCLCKNNQVTVLLKLK